MIDSRVLLMGLDGMDPKVTSTLLDEGKLPNFERLETFSDLSTSYPPNSPVAWSSIATGSNPGKHNIFDFIRRNPKRYVPELSLFKAVGRNYYSYFGGYAFWKWTTKKGIPSNVIRYPMTFPPQQISGNMLSGLGVPDVRGFLSGYSLYTTKESSDDNVITVEQGDLIKTYLRGPKTPNGEIKSSLDISVSDNSATLKVDKTEQYLKEKQWSDWIRVKFSVGMFSSISGICKAYLISSNPFEMYVTTIQIDPEKPQTDISSPREYSKELAEEIGLFYTLGIPEETDPYREGRIEKGVFLDQCFQIEEQREKMFWHEFTGFKGLYAFVFDTSDRMQHVFWNNKILAGDEFEVSPEIESYWMKKDKLVGSVLDTIGEASLFIVSDHGFTSFERAASINTWLVENDYMVLTEELGDNEWPLFEKVDWSKTQAYSLGFNSLYVNAKGREEKGIVEDKEGLVREITSKLELLKDDMFGGKVINKAYAREDIYSGEFLKNAPDIILGFNPGYRMAWQTAAGGFTKDVITDNTNKWNGDHLVDPKFVPGVLFSNVKINSKKPSQLDLAPTILDTFGISNEEMDGKSLL